MKIYQSKEKAENEVGRENRWKDRIFRSRLNNYNVMSEDNLEFYSEKIFFFVLEKPNLPSLNLKKNKKNLHIKN